MMCLDCGKPAEVMGRCVFHHCCEITDLQDTGRMFAAGVAISALDRYLLEEVG